MQRLTRIRLMDEGLRSVTTEDGTYFIVSDIRSRYPTIKINVDKIKALSFDGETLNAIRAEDTAPMTDFDRSIMQTIRNKK